MKGNLPAQWGSKSLTGGHTPLNTAEDLNRNKKKLSFKKNLIKELELNPTLIRPLTHETNRMVLFRKAQTAPQWTGNIQTNILRSVKQQNISEGRAENIAQDQRYPGSRKGRSSWNKVVTPLLNSVTLGPLIVSLGFCSRGNYHGRCLTGLC